MVVFSSPIDEPGACRPFSVGPIRNQREASASRRSITPYSSSSSRRSGTPQTSSRRSTRSPSPKTVRFATPDPDSCSEYSDDGSDEEEEEVVILEQDPSTLIAKPAGEAGRPNRGGYTLNDVLKESGWSEKHITLFKDKVKECADAHLDTSAPYTRQEQAAMRDFKAAMMDEWKAGDGGRRGLPDLADYAHMWPLTDQVKAYLKYSSTKSAKKKKAKDR